MFNDNLLGLGFLLIALYIYIYIYIYYEQKWLEIDVFLLYHLLFDCSQLVSSLHYCQKEILCEKKKKDFLKVFSCTVIT